MSKSAKYKKSFDSFIRQILDMELEEDDSLEEGVTAQSSSEEGPCEGADAGESSSEGVFSITPGETYSIAGGRVVQCTPVQAEERPVRAQPVFFTSEQLKALRLRETPGLEPDTRGIISPGTKFRRKKPVKKCSNLDCP